MLRAKKSLHPSRIYLKKQRKNKLSERQKELGDKLCEKLMLDLSANFNLNFAIELTVRRMREMGLTEELNMLELYILARFKEEIKKIKQF